LVTGWREAKPCIRAFKEGLGAAPVVTFIYCEDRLTSRRATAWAKQLDSSFGQVRVVSNVAEMSPLLLQAFHAEGLNTVVESDYNEKTIAPMTFMPHCRSLGAELTTDLGRSVLAPAVQNTMMLLMIQSRRRSSVQQLLIASYHQHLAEHG
jgi:hypothetical protein